MLYSAPCQDTHAEKEFTLCIEETKHKWTKEIGNQPAGALLKVKVQLQMNISTVLKVCVVCLVLLGAFSGQLAR